MSSVAYTVVDAAGAILKSGTAPSKEAALLQGARVLIGVRGNDATQHVVDGALIDKPPVPEDLETVKIEMREHVQRQAAAQRAAIMPAHEVLALVVDVMDFPDGVSRALLTDWRARVAAIDAARDRAVFAIVNTATPGAARAAAEIDWSDIT